MSVTSVADYLAFGGPIVTAQQSDLLPVMLDVAEDYILREVGCAFYDADDPTSRASREWRYLAWMLARDLIATGSDQWNDERQSPYDFTSTASGSKRVKDPFARLATNDPTFKSIVAYYQHVCGYPNAATLSLTPERA